MRPGPKAGVVGIAAVTSAAILCIVTIVAVRIPSVQGPRASKSLPDPWTPEAALNEVETHIRTADKYRVISPLQPESSAEIVVPSATFRVEGSNLIRETKSGRSVICRNVSEGGFRALEADQGCMLKLKYVRPDGREETATRTVSGFRTPSLATSRP